MIIIICIYLFIGVLLTLVCSSGLATLAFVFLALSMILIFFFKTYLHISQVRINTVFFFNLTDWSVKGCA